MAARYWLDKIELAYLGSISSSPRSFSFSAICRAPSGVLRQQLKWVTAGTFAGILPFVLFYIVPYVFGLVPRRG